jgi:Domain of unknown function (DUF4406)
MTMFDQTAPPPHRRHRVLLDIEVDELEQLSPVSGQGMSEPLERIVELVYKLTVPDEAPGSLPVDLETTSTAPGWSWNLRFHDRGNAVTRESYDEELRAWSQARRVVNVPTGMPKLYLIGPMTGFDDFNYPAFHEAEDRLRAAGYDVLSPAIGNPPTAEEAAPYAFYFKRGLGQLLQCDAIAWLPGYGLSKGAQLEERIGETLAMRIRNVDAWIREAEAAR